MIFWIAIVIVYGGFFGGFLAFSYLSWKTENGPKKDIPREAVQKVDERTKPKETLD